MPHTQAADGSSPALGQVTDNAGRPRYVLERLLDEGGSEGRVFLARDANTDDVVALKQFTAGLIHGPVGRDLGDRLRMLRGASLQLRTVQGLVGYLDPFEGMVPETTWAPLGWWLPMEYVAGENLAQLLRDGLRGDERLRILTGLRQVARTLEQLARLQPPVAHRDIKPANIVVRPTAHDDVDCVLVDIGLMARADRDHSSTVGSNGYMAPELVDGHPVSREELHLADWYSFTALLFAVTANTPPPAAPERWEEALADSGLPEKVVRTLVAAGTAPPRGRPMPSTVVDAVVLNLEPHTGVGTASVQSRRFHVVWAAAATVVCIGLATAIWGWGVGRSTAEAGQAPMSTRPASPVPVTQGGTSKPSSSPATPQTPVPSKPMAPTAGAFLSFSAGATQHACAIDGNRRLYCWGNDNAGQLGDESTQTRGDASQVVGISDVTQVAVGGSTTCAISATTGLMCWGDNGQGQVGDGTTKTRFLPTPVLGLDRVVEVSVGSHQVCARTEPGDVYCWGSADNGTMQTSRPAKVRGLKPAIAIAVGMDHVCAIDRDGAVWCWGSNGAGQFGDGGPGGGGPMFTLIPQRIKGVPPAKSVAAGPLSTYAITSRGLYGWGADDNGRLGAKALVGKFPAPLAIRVPDVIAVAPGSDHACALTAGGLVYCFGGNRMGQIGDGTTQQRNTPSLVRALTGALAIAAGEGFSCAFNEEGRPECWGAHNEGPIQTVYDRPIPMQFTDPHAPPSKGGGM